MIIDLQRRMVEAGRIRAGEKGSKGEPRKLDKWRLTSKDRIRLEQAAELWGGEVREWEEQFELYTKTDSLPIMLLPGQLPTTWYELWSKGGCQRRCDGQHELISDSSCLCGEERECKPHTRLSVLLPDLPGLGSWLLSSTGWNAAAELAGSADLLQRASAQGVLIPARLILEQRHEVKSGQTRRYAVPVISVDVSMRQLLGQPASLAAPEMAALPAGYTPVPAGNGHGVSLAQGLAEAESAEVKRTSRSAAPIPSVDDDIEFGTAPVPVDEEAPPPPTHEENIEALNALVGQLRDDDHITTRQLWVKIARGRGQKVDDLIAKNKGIGEDGALHWSPLRDMLFPAEAVELRKGLGRLWAENNEAKE